MDTTLDNLTNKLKHLAKQHAFELANNQENKSPTTEGEFNLKEICKALLSMDFINDFDKATIEQTLTSLEEAIRDLISLNVLTRSKHSKRRMPVAFDALVEIFTASSEEFRQRYFHELITLYYRQLCINLHELQSKHVLDKVSFDYQVKFLLPLVKLRLITQCSKENSYPSKNRLFSNVTSYFKFPTINQEDVYEVLRNKIGSSNFNLESYELIPLDEKNGHLGEYFKLRIKLNVGKDVQQFDLFAKFLTPKSEGMKKMVLSGPSKKEEFFYMTYIPFVKKHGLQELLNFAPRCYFSRVNDVLILDDMAANGFVGLTPNKLLKYEALHKVIEKMASFHAATMILEEMLSHKEEKRVTIYDLYAEFLQEAFFVPDDDYFLKPSFLVGLEAMHHIASKFPEITKKFSEEFLRDKINKGWDLQFKKLTKSDILKNTICHGDMYVANMLFNYTKEKACQDQSCTKEERDKYYEKLTNEYYQELTRHIQNFGFHINKVYPRKEFENSLKYMKSQALFQALYYSPLTMLSPKLRENIFLSEEKADYYMNKCRWELVDIGLEDDAYRTVMKGFVEDLVELCENADL